MGAISGYWKDSLNAVWNASSVGTATWEFDTTYGYRCSYSIKAPDSASNFSVAVPGSTPIKEFSVTAKTSQILGSTYTGSSSSEDTLKVVSGGSIEDAMFELFSSVEELELKGNVGYVVELGSMAENAGIREVEGSYGGDTIDASEYLDGIEIEGGYGNDDLIGGFGDDSFEGGRGLDKISLAPTEPEAGETYGADVVEYDSRLDGSTVGVAGSSFSGYDEITGFDNSASPTGDKIDIDYKFKSIEYIDGYTNSLTSVDEVVAAMNSELVNAPNLAYSLGHTVIFVINANGSELAGVYSATIKDSDNNLLNGLQAVASNPYMLASVDSALMAGNVV